VNEAFDAIKESHPRFYAAIGCEDQDFAKTAIMVMEQLKEISFIAGAHPVTVTDDVLMTLVDSNNYQPLSTVKNSFGLLSKVKLLTSSVGVSTLLLQMDPEPNPIAVAAAKKGKRKKTDKSPEDILAEFVAAFKELQADRDALRERVLELETKPTSGILSQMEDLIEAVRTKHE